ncbi:hypothetical protein [Nonomuraea sp. KM90]|uniref:hypothetical protein n=1 Tax=Nonomuraea sp. KM90 TaxID=3457428 RepID=UPI003FCE5631
MTDSSLWDRVSSAPRRRAAKQQSGKQVETPGVRSPSPRKLRGAQVIALLLWLYIFVKMFFLDIDYVLITELFPDAPWVLDLRIILIAGLLVALVHSFRRYVWWILYIVFFPVILAAWHVPLRLYKFWSWDLAIALTQIAYSVGRNYKANISVRVAEICCIFLVAGVKPPILMLPLGSVLLLCLIWTFARTFISVFASRHFLRAHAEVAKRILRSGQVMKWSSLPQSLSKSRAKRFNTRQTEELAKSLSSALLVIKASDFYAYRLDRYRKSPAPYILSLLSYVVLFAYTTVNLAIVNVVVYKFSTSQFKLDQEFSFLGFLHYALSSLALNGVDGIVPVGDIAIALKVFSGFFGAVVGLTLLVDVFFSFKKQRDDEIARETIDAIKTEAGRVVTRVESEYQITHREALQRLQDLGLATTLGMVLWFSAQIPEDDDGEKME